MTDTEEMTDAEELGAVPDIQDPLLPLHGWWPDTPGGWPGRARQLAAEARQADPRLVFLGDSITQGWGLEGRAEWDTRFAPLHAVNLGMGGDRTQQILRRINDGALEGLGPAVVVLLIGVNNLWHDVYAFGPERVADGIAAVVSAIESRLPETKILVLGILPTQADPAHPLRGLLQEINARSAARFSVAGSRVRFADFGPLFLEPDGTIAPDIMPDACHLSPRGYAIFADALEPLVRALLPSAD